MYVVYSDIASLAGDWGISVSDGRQCDEGGTSGEGYDTVGSTGCVTDMGVACASRSSGGGSGGNVDFGRSIESCNLGRWSTGGADFSNGKGILDFPGVGSNDSEASGLAMVSLPMVNGDASIDIDDLRSADWREGEVRGSASDISSPRDGGGTRLIGSVFRDSIDGCSCSEGRGILIDCCEFRPDCVSPIPMCCQSSTDPRATTSTDGRFMMLSFFASRPNTLPRFSFGADNIDGGSAELRSPAMYMPLGSVDDLWGMRGSKGLTGADSV